MVITELFTSVLVIAIVSVCVLVSIKAEWKQKLKTLRLDVQTSIVK